MAAALPRCFRWLLVAALLLAALPAPARAQDAPAAPAAPLVSFPGNYGEALGAPSWAPDDPAVAASDPDGDGIYTLTLTLPRGDYEFKVAINGSWEENYGRGGARDGENIPFSVAEAGAVTLTFDIASHAIGAAAGAVVLVRDGEPLAAPAAPRVPGDGQIDGAALRHDSRSDLYRFPFGAVPAGSMVTLRLCTQVNDVERVRLLVDTLDADLSFSQPMTQVAHFDGCDLWATTLAVGDKPVVHNYTFEVGDGATTLYVADDAALDGGAGTVANTRPAAGRGWDIYTYLPGFSAPDWAQNAIIYQIFPDRFRNGDPSNDPQADDFGYPEERGQAFPITPWNTIVPDPDPNDPANPWRATWNSTFYGGDLQGVMEKLDYLQALGVNTIYFTPINEAVTNHRYDVRDYRQVDDNLAVRGDPAASMAYFDQFAQAVADRGMHLILDAVPNHTSADSPMFDLYSRWEEEGACESERSAWRTYYLFEDARPAGSGACAGDANYRGFAGIGTLPQANTADESVIDNWLGTDGIANFWLDKPGVDGWRVDTVPDVVAVNPTFFEPFRTVVKAAHPKALLLAETWPESAVRERVLGDEFDSTMNYRFAFSVLGFLRDTPFTLTTDPQPQPLTATQFDAALRAIQEDYPPAAFSTAMNLLSSHDINRAVRVLDHDGLNADGQPANGFADGRARLALAAVLQYTLPGAPTTFYGDEVGLVGYGSDPTRDDPHNRQPYPWADEPGYDTLPAWRKADANLLSLYQALGQLRAAHSYLRTGDWTTLGTDNRGIYTYLRSDQTGAAVVAVNRSPNAMDASVHLDGRLPFGTVLTDALNAITGTTALTATVQADGRLTFTVPAMAARVLITPLDVDMRRPPAPTLAAVAGSGAVTLTVTVSDGLGALIYASQVDGGGFDAVGAAPDAGGVLVLPAVNGRSYFYRAVAVNAQGLRSKPSATVAARPTVQISVARLGGPVALTTTVSAITPTAVISGIVRLADEQAATTVRAQLGLLPEGVADFTWTPAAFAGDMTTGELAGGRIFVTTLLPETPGQAIYKWRFSVDEGQSWTLSDAGTLTVLPAADSEAPKPPFRLDPIASSASQLALAWRVSRPPDLAFYRICRADASAGETGCAWQVDAPKTTNIFTDTTVTTGHTYTYTVQVVDTAFNVSPPSKPLALTAELSTVAVTFRVRVPDATPPDAQIYLAGDNPDVFGAAFAPALLPLQNLGGGLWEVTVQAKDGIPLQYKYTRGAWEMVEQWGSIAGYTNRTVTIAKQPDGTMLVDDTATDWGSGPDDHKAVQAWRDPLVQATSPAPDSSGVAESVSVTMTIIASSRDLPSVIAVADAAGAPVAGTVAAAGANAFTWTPAAPLAPGAYTATVANIEATTPMIAPYTWTFTVQ